MTRKAYAKKFTPEQKAEYHKAQREEAAMRLADAVADLETSDGFKAWLEARAKFHSYSFNNVLLIVSQYPDATRVAAASLWREMGRYIMKDERSIKVYAPIDMWVPADEGETGSRWNDKRKRFEKKVMGFKLVPVFDVAQTDGDPLPQPTLPERLDGDSHSHLEKPLKALAKSLGYKVKDEAMDEEQGGYCDPVRKVIALNKSLSPNARIRTLTHEIAHALGIGYKEFTREQAEVMVESVTYIVLAGVGLETDIASVPYIAAWGRGNGTMTIGDYAAKIDEVARTIESAIAE